MDKPYDDLIFVHVPKTAGTSIRAALKFNMRSGNTTHFTATHPKVLKRLSEAKRPMIFAVSRNPYDRAWSAFHFYGLDRPNRKKRSSKTFAIFFKLVEVNHFWENVDLQALARVMTHFKPQTHFINSPIVRVIRFENLQEDFDNLMVEIGRDKIKLPNENFQKKPQSWKTGFSPKAIERINEFYHEDFEAFNYEKIKP